MNARRLPVVFALLGALVPGAALAQPISEGDRGAARQLAIDGFSALERKDYAGAADRFTRAGSLIHAPTVTLGLARAQVGLGKLVSAQESYNRLIREPLPRDASAAFIKAVDEGRAELAALTPRIPSLIIEVKGADGPRVTLDGEPVAPAVLGVRRPVDPGRHVVQVTAQGSAPRETAVSVREGQTETVVVDMKAAQPSADPSRGAPPPGDSSPASPQKIAGFAALGVGGAGLVVGAITTGLAASKHASLLAQCPSGHCAPSQAATLQPDVDTYRTLGGLGLGGLIGGGALAIGGVILVVTAPKTAPRAGFVTPVVGPGFAGAAAGGTFR